MACEAVNRIKDKCLDPQALRRSAFRSPDKLCAIRHVADELILVHEFGRPKDKLGGPHRKLAFTAEAMQRDRPQRRLKRSRAVEAVVAGWHSYA